MLRLCLEKYSDTHDILITFANTGCEHEETLRFVDAVDKHIADGKVVWIEAEIHGPRKGPTAKIVNYETASRNGEPFEAAIAKHGVNCQSHPGCTARLKLEPMTNYIRSQGWKRNTYDTAIGIRADEIDRYSSKAKEQRLVYPLVEAGLRKQDVNRIMRQYEWDLKIPNDAYGNCVWCWKKSLRKLMTLAKDDPSIFDFPGHMERKYGMVNNSRDEQIEPRVFFRGHRSAQDILKLAQTENFKPYTDAELQQQQLFDPDLDVGSGCGESCEIGADE